MNTDTLPECTEVLLLESMLEKTMCYMKTHFQSVKDKTIQANQKDLPKFMRKALVKISNKVEETVLAKMKYTIKEIIKQKIKRHHELANFGICEDLEESIRKEYWWILFDIIEEFQKQNLFQMLNMFNVTTLTFSKRGQREHVITSVIEDKYVLYIISKWEIVERDIERVKNGYLGYKSVLMAFDNGQIGEEVYNENWGYDPPGSINYEYNCGRSSYHNITEIFDHLSEIM